MFQEPAPTNYDLYFKFLKTSVRISPLFWVVSLIFGISPQSMPIDVLIWILAVFISILLHEMGHIIAIRYFGEDGYIVLHGFGGLAISNRNYIQRTAGQQITISLAGPIAGFLFAAIIYGLNYLYRHFAYLIFPFLIDSIGYDTTEIIDNLLFKSVNTLLYINVYWGFVNLLPVYPLDGGQASMGIFSIFDPKNGPRKSLQLSTVTGVVVAVLAAIILNSIYIGFLFGYLAYQSYQILLRNMN